ncbi:tyrosine-type recombinase/integrase [Aureibacter tunicatorum]|uniref:Integrase/recombinase XerD n=1 Tax=Aureibacter tunicatorum TaxID=866807 RepID=A0AAE3XU23_9BACT|nr:tyrosine-type recombinase/integrase [Aureibacter tunicatorum]MDR6242093.1 integrase/recombinase XerD [Aureibacter tunicatorum]BDD05641.1 tyrosine recombinase XerD [Aureibacter tunicatorum]BDD07146.1 tyrosine recombinase XerD [Aureibacter tunicatorum]BDD07152.1 tyrosine recombinase XerD [Aureibacter tunicatorum]
MNLQSLYFQTHLTNLGYSKSTLRMLPACINAFLSFTQKKIHDINPEDIQSFHNHLQERPNKKRFGGLSDSYIQHHIYAMRLFFQWKIDSGELNSNPISGLHFPSPQQSKKEILTQQEVKQLYNYCHSLQERALLSVFYGCGLRRSEGEALDLRDLHFVKQMLYVRSGKNGRWRAVPMSDKVTEDLERYSLYSRIPKGTNAFFCNSRGQRMSGVSMNRMLHKILDRAGIRKKISLHHLRHSIASHLLENGLSAEYVRNFLGHKHLDTTQIYTQISQQQLDTWN